LHRSPWPSSPLFHASRSRPPAWKARPCEQRHKSSCSPGADTLYKLDTLKSLLDGVRTRVMLVSYHPLSAWDRQRAADLNIEICSARQLPQLREILKQWIGR
jgi:hypothetical protein